MGSFALFTACASVDKKAYDWTQVTSGKWSSSAKITEKKTDKTQTFDLGFRAIKEKKARIDVSVLMGTPVASIVVENDKIEAVLIRQKKIYSGKSTPKVMKEALGFAFDPKLISTVLFESTSSQEKWECVDDGDQLKKCVGPNDTVIINWENRKDVQRTVKLETLDFILEINFNEFTPDELLDSKTFVIKKPKSFKKIDLNSI